MIESLRQPLQVQHWSLPIWKWQNCVTGKSVARVCSHNCQAEASYPRWVWGPALLCGDSGCQGVLRKEGPSSACVRSSLVGEELGELWCGAKSVSFPDSASLSSNPWALCPSLTSAACPLSAPSRKCGKWTPTGEPASVQPLSPSPSSSRMEFWAHSLATASPSRPFPSLFA